MKNRQREDRFFSYIFFFLSILRCYKVLFVEENTHFYWLRYLMNECMSTLKNDLFENER